MLKVLEQIARENISILLGQSHTAEYISYSAH